MTSQQILMKKGNFWNREHRSKQKHVLPYYHSNNILKEIKIKSHTTYYFDDIIIINVINDLSPDVLIEEK